MPSLIDRLNQLIMINEPELIVLRTEREQRTLDQQIRREQEEEYLKSLQADQEKVAIAYNYLQPTFNYWIVLFILF